VEEGHGERLTGKECHWNGRRAQKDTRLVERCQRRTLESSVRSVRAAEMAGDDGGKDGYGNMTGWEAAVGWASRATAWLGSFAQCGGGQNR
jgi:hypothetical protein